MKRKLGWYWVITLMIAPLLIIAGLVLWRGSAAATSASDVVGLHWGDVKVVMDRNPPSPDWPVESVNALPGVKQLGTAFPLNLSHMNLSKADLSKDGSTLVNYAMFDAMTTWPAKLPAEFDPRRIMEIGKNPGLGVRDLHQQGITGKGIHVAVIDQTLWRGHSEYTDRIVSYTEVGDVIARTAEISGAANASLLAGKTVGVAPDVSVHYYAAQYLMSYTETPLRITYRYIAATINKILDDNQTLPSGQQIRVIQVAIGATQGALGLDEIRQAYDRAKREGVLIVSPDMRQNYAYSILGLGRDPYLDPDDYHSYAPGMFWADQFYREPSFPPPGSNVFYVPMDSHTLAMESGRNDYRFWREAGQGIALPYVTGLYALALQVNPQVTPDEFLKAAYETGDYNTVTHDGKEYKLGPIVNPARLIQHVNH